MYENVAIILSVLAIVISVVSSWNSWKTRTFTEKTKKKAEISDELGMYTDIAYSNHWNWLPRDVGLGDPRYLEYTEVIKRFVSYLERVDPEIKDTYRYVVDKFNSGYERDEKPQVWEKYEEIRDFSKNKARELGEQLRRI